MYKPEEVKTMIKNCRNCADILCKENKRELCKDHDTGVWHWGFWQSMTIRED